MTDQQKHILKEFFANSTLAVTVEDALRSYFLLPSGKEDVNHLAAERLVLNKIAPAFDWLEQQTKPEGKREEKASIAL